MTDLYLPCVMIQDKHDERAWMCGSYESELTLEDALKVIEKHKENHIVLCAWVWKYRKKRFKQPVFFECYTNALGMVNDRFVG